MPGKWQFSLWFLLVELTGIAVVVSLLRAAMHDSFEPVAFLLVLFAGSIGGAVIGALFGRAGIGLILGIILVVIADAILPKVH